MSYALDTNVLARSIEASHSMHITAKQAVEKLIDSGEELVIFPQNLYEFWAISTRPRKNSGLELSSTEALLHLEKFETIFSLRPDNPEVYYEWKNLVSQHKAIGKPSHDARIAAAMKVHAVTHLLIFNTDDFKRFTDVISVNPLDV